MSTIDLLVSLLPYLLIIFVWIIIMIKLKKSVKKTGNFEKKQDEVISLLSDIKIELKEMNRNNSQKKI